MQQEYSALMTDSLQLYRKWQIKSSKLILIDLILEPTNLTTCANGHEIAESEFDTEKLRNTAHSSSVLAVEKLHTFQAFFCATNFEWF